MSGRGLYLTLCLLALAFVHVRSSVPWRECEPLVHHGGLIVKNCSGKDQIKLPDLEAEAEVLDFSNNRFTEVPLIPESPECSPVGEHGHCEVANTTNHCVVDISFSRNEIYRFHEEAFHQLRCLRRLDLSYNDIKSDIFHANMFLEGLYHLQVFSLRGNPLGSLPDDIISAPFMHDLSDLDLSHCDLESIGRNSVDDHSNLRRLDLSYNKLETIHFATFKGLSSLEYLDLRQNRLTFLSDRVFGDLISLKTLRLSNNNIQMFHPNAFFSDSSLQLLELQSNSFQRIPYEAVDKLPKLKTMDLSNNPISTVLAGSGVSNVQTLVLDHLYLLQELGPNALTSFPALQSLSVSQCKMLTRIHPNILARNSSALREVDVSINGLSTLTSNAFPWNQLRTLKLGSNPWNCDLSLAWIIDARSVQGSPVCSAPMKLRGRPIQSLQSYELGRYFSVTPTTAIIASLLLLPLVSVFAFLIWKRRHHCRCVNVQVKGRYISVYTRDMDREGEDRVAIELKVNVNRLKTVSNGDADDTKPFITIDHENEEEEEDEVVELNLRKEGRDEI